MSIIKKIKQSSLGALCACSLLIASSVQAVVIYDEGVTGDLGSFDTTTFDLVAGVNSILGSSEYSSSRVDFDGFLVYFDTGLVLSRVDYYATNLVNAASIFGAIELREGAHDTPETMLARTFFRLRDSFPQPFFSEALPLAASGTYAFTPTGLGRSGGGGTWDYEIQFTVLRAVPEPSIIALFGLGLLGLGFSRRRTYSVLPVMNSIQASFKSIRFIAA